ncbi:MAG: hypothetical protein PHI22_00810 [Bacilli bacterium]|nr:hypothetical protein [Bacilli bacterium]
MTLNVENEVQVKANVEMEVLSREKVIRGLKSQTISQFMRKYSKISKFNIDKDHKVKLCSSDTFINTVKDLSNKYKDKESPIIMGQVSGFYEIATLAGLTAQTCKEKTKPFVLIFDRDLNNMQNAIFNSLLINMSNSKEEFLVKLFGLRKIDILKAFDLKQYSKMLKEVRGSSDTNHFADEEELDQYIEGEYIEGEYIDNEMIDNILRNQFKFKNLENYVRAMNRYDADAHYNLLIEDARNKLRDKTMFKLFKTTARNICDYLAMDNNYYDFIQYLSDDLKRNNGGHILNNDDAFLGYKSLMLKSGKGNIKFLPGVDISTPEGLEQLSSTLKAINIISDQVSNDTFPVDIAVIPHIHRLKDTYPFIKKTVQDYVVADRDSQKTKCNWSSHPTATLNIRSYNSIGAQFIKDERDNRIPLTDLHKIEPVKGFPLISFIAGANYGNIYHSEIDTQNMIDMAIADGVDTICIQGLFYATYYHHQTSRRMLNDPSYETLDARLKVARKLIKKINDAGIKVIYQMGDEENHLYQDMFKIYTREQGVTGANFLKREDLRTRYDWVRPVISQQLIPYLIRRGEDITMFNTDEATKTRVSEVCHALKAYYEGSPLGDLAKYIDPQYLEDTDMFKVVFSTVVNYDEKDPALSLNLINNPNFSYITQYGNPDAGIRKYIRTMQTGAVSKYPINQIPQLTVDSRQGYMSLEVMDDQIALNVPQMINDEWYITEQGLLPGTKEHILADPTHKRVTQMQTKPNYPGGWTITGDAREILRIVPYYKRVREVMEYVQKTGEALPELSVLHVNDTQFGSPTERIKYFLKMLDVAFYKYNIRGIWGNGDYQQGWNYPKFALESRHLGSMSVSQQMIDAVKLQRPWIRRAFGVVNPDIFEVEDPKLGIKIDSERANQILSSLVNSNLIKVQNGIYGKVYAIDKDIDYKVVDLRLPSIYRQYEQFIREKLCSIHRLWFYHLVEGNHEYNTDWNQKGYKLIEHLKQDLDNLKAFSGTDLEVVLTEYFVNKNGDIVNAPYGSKTINGYNIAYGHKFRAPGKGGGGSPTRAMANYFEQMGLMSNKFDRAFMGHLHVYSTAVINNMMLSITGCSAGQSGYEQELGYKSQPMYVIDRYMPDGRIVVDTVGTKFLDTWEIQNPEVAAIGLDNFVEQCLTQEAPTFGPDEPEKVQELHVRKLVPSGVNKVIGPKIK